MLQGQCKHLLVKHKNHLRGIQRIHLIDMNINCKTGSTNLISQQIDAIVAV